MKNVLNFKTGQRLIKKKHKQLGFREQMGCRDAISYFSKLVYEALDKGRAYLFRFILVHS